MSTLYVDHDYYAAAWVENLMEQGLVSAGEVSRRGVETLVPADLGHRRVHLFAGMAGWEEALRLAGWPDERPVWTMSLPCQPYSVSGLQKGAEDERALWPAAFRLVEQCAPGVIFGEQVASRLGYAWFRGVHGDLERAGYAVAGAELPAGAVNAPHKRRRLWWVAARRGDGAGAASSVAHPLCDGERAAPRDGSAVLPEGKPGDVGRAGSVGVGDAAVSLLDASDCRQAHSGPAVAAGHWDDWTVVQCRDGKQRRVGAGLCVVANGVSGRIPQLRAIGNAIVPHVAARFARAFLAAEVDLHLVRQRLGRAVG